MDHEFTLWIVVMAAALHVAEEKLLDWRGWAGREFGFAVTWADFYVVNATMIVFMIAAAMIGWRLPEVSLVMPALMVINALVFHLGATVIRRNLSPGTITGILVYLPAATWAYYGAYLDGVLTLRAGLVSALGGALLMACPVIIQRLRVDHLNQRSS